ncbi:MAG: glycerophosphodiester phosphodiesterase [bacterium]
MEPDDGLEIIAHRGLHHKPEVRENSREAITGALDSSVAGIEVDLQLLGDGTLVLFHDDSIKTSSYYPLSSLTYSQFRSLVDFDPLRLEDLLELDWKGKRMILECKPNRNHVSLVRRLLLSLPNPDSSLPLMLSSYDPDILTRLAARTEHNLAPVISSFSGRITRLLKSNRWSEYHLDSALIDNPMTSQLVSEDDVILWTINDTSGLEQLERLGIKGIMSDNPDAF